MATLGHHTVDNIKETCEQHFTELKESDDLVCDVLAGEQGPSCRTIGQIPDQKVFHVRFVYANSLGDRSIVKQDACTGVRSACRREENWAQSGYLCTTPSAAQAGADAGISWS